jgi:hypothetical protein
MPRRLPSAFTEITKNDQRFCPGSKVAEILTNAGDTVTAAGPALLARGGMAKLQAPVPAPQRPIFPFCFAKLLRHAALAGAQGPAGSSKRYDSASHLTSNHTWAPCNAQAHCTVFSLACVRRRRMVGVMTDQSRQSSIDEFQCARCGAVYDVAVTHRAPRAEYVAVCIVCCELVNEWLKMVGRATTLKSQPAHA